VDTARSASRRTARQEFGLTQDEIYDAIDAGTLHYRQAAMHGNPWLRLLRREVEALARTSHSDRYVEERQARAELARVSREIKRRRAELAALEERRSKLSSGLGSERLGDRSLASAGLMSDTRSVVSLSRRVPDSAAEPGELTVDFGEAERLGFPRVLLGWVLDRGVALVRHAGRVQLVRVEHEGRSNSDCITD
jgi:hypothetical protein